MCITRTSNQVVLVASFTGPNNTNCPRAKIMKTTFKIKDDYKGKIKASNKILIKLF